MASYSMYGNSGGYGFGGGGLGGLGDIGQSFMYGMSNAMPFLTNLYNFQDANAMRPDLMNAKLADLRNSRILNENANILEQAKQNVLLNDWQQLPNKQQTNASGLNTGTSTVNTTSVPNSTYTAATGQAAVQAPNQTLPAAVAAVNYDNGNRALSADGLAYAPPQMPWAQNNQQVGLGSLRYGTPDNGYYMSPSWQRLRALGGF